MYHIERLRGQELPPELHEDWNRLAGDIPFRRWEWLANWWKYYRETSELYTLVVRDDAGMIRAIAPWRIRRSVVGGRIIEPLGCGKVSSDYVSLLCAPGDELLVADPLADWLTTANSGFLASRGDAWDMLFLSAMVEGDTGLSEIAKRLAKRGCLSSEIPGLRTWRIPLLGSWETYLASLSKPVRRQAKKVHKKIQEEDGIDYFEATDEASLERGFSILVDLHQRRWEDVGIDGCFTDDRFTRFLRDACQDFLALGKVHLSWLEQAGKPFVVNIEFEGGGMDYVYQGGMDPESRPLSPGWLHMVHLFQRSIALGRTHRDYLRGDEPYKKHWRGTPTQLIDLRIVPPHVTARLRHGVWELGNSLKHWMKQRLQSKAPVKVEAKSEVTEASENP
jgi:CelD/BcsL family acetyltransferase involved in cellulose biosynthesis